MSDTTMGSLASIVNVEYGYQRGKPVLHDLTVEIDGQSAVLLGPNAAGKTTLIRLLVGVSRPWSGSVMVGGHSTIGRLRLRELRAAVGWVPQNIESIPGFGLRDHVAYAGWLKGMPRRLAWARAGEVLDLVRLAPFGEQPVRSLSGGQRRRMGIAQALVHDPAVVVMDEPTAGLDPQQRRAFRGIVADLRQKTKLLISTHQTEDIMHLGESVVVLDKGQLRFAGTMASFLDHSPSPGSTAERAEHAYVSLMEPLE